MIFYSYIGGLYISALLVILFQYIYANVLYLIFSIDNIVFPIICIVGLYCIGLSCTAVLPSWQIYFVINTHLCIYLFFFICVSVYLHINVQLLTYLTLRAR